MVFQGCFIDVLLVIIWAISKTKVAMVHPCKISQFFIFKHRLRELLRQQDVFRIGKHEFDDRQQLGLLAQASELLFKFSVSVGIFTAEH